MRAVLEPSFLQFEWDVEKARANYEEHGISFEEAAEALSYPHLEEQSDRNGEKRTLTVCRLSRRIIAVIYTVRNDKCRIISARAARNYEQREYRHIFDRPDS